MGSLSQFKCRAVVTPDNQTSNTRRMLSLSTTRTGPGLEILGSPDDLKFWSCLTLFRRAASEDLDRMLFTEALDQFYDGKPDPRTLALLG